MCGSMYDKGPQRQSERYRSITLAGDSRDRCRWPIPLIRGIPKKRRSSAPYEAPEQVAMRRTSR